MFLLTGILIFEIAMEKICLIYITVESHDEARDISNALLNEALAACVNILGQIDSMFLLENKVVSKREIGLLVKTTMFKADAVISRVKEFHSYDCPCIIKLRVDGGNPEFLKWVAGGNPYIK